MKRRLILSSALAGAALPHGVLAQPTGRVVRIGWLTAQRAASLALSVAAFRNELAVLGHVEGSNTSIEFRYGDDVVVNAFLPSSRGGARARVFGRGGSRVRAVDPVLLHPHAG